jgi:serine/threonine protein kinase
MINASWGIMIGDFGLSKVVTNANTYFSTKKGTQLFMAPELHSDDGYTKFSFATDMYSIGVNIYYILTRST